MQIRIINAPAPDLLEMLARRVAPGVRKWIEENRVSAIGFVQASVPDLFHFADIAGKSAHVMTVELSGTCPQTTTTLAVLGETASVRAAMDAIAAQAPAF